MLTGVANAAPKNVILDSLDVAPATTLSEERPELQVNEANEQNVVDDQITGNKDIDDESDGINEERERQTFTTEGETEKINSSHVDESLFEKEEDEDNPYALSFDTPTSRPPICPPCRELYFY